MRVQLPTVYITQHRGCWLLTTKPPCETLMSGSPTLCMQRYRWMIPEVLLVHQILIDFLYRCVCLFIIFNTLIIYIIPACFLEWLFDVSHVDTRLAFPQFNSRFFGLIFSEFVPKVPDLWNGHGLRIPWRIPTDVLDHLVDLGGSTTVWSVCGLYWIRKGKHTTRTCFNMRK